MKALVNEKYGPPEALRLLDVPVPSPKPGELLVKVHAATVNRTDSGFLRAKPFIVRFFSGLTRPRHAIKGCEFAGVVEAVGSAVTTFKPGDRVFGYNEVSFGGHGEFLTIPADGMVATIPDKFSFTEAAPATEGGHYAHSSIKAAGVKSGQKVLINGASGGIGSAAVQIVKSYGAHVTAVCGTKNLELVKSLGADVVIDYEKVDFTKSDEAYDFIFDAVGKSTFGACKALLKPEGIYCSTELGPHNENPFLAIRGLFSGGKKVIFAFPLETQAEVLFLKELMETGRYKPVIDRTYTLEQIPEAYRYVESGQKTGNVVIAVLK